MGYAYPTEAHFGRAVTPREYEELTAPQTPDGLIGHPGMDPLVYADSTIHGVRVRPGRDALVRGLRWVSGDNDQLLLDPNTTSGSTRIDLIVVRATRNPWNAGLAVVKGVAESNPVAPAPTYGTNTATGVWELPVAEVSVPYNTSSTATLGAGQVTPKAWYVGADGQLLCTAATRPPHEAGRIIWQTDSHTMYISSGSTWWPIATRPILAGRTTITPRANSATSTYVNFPAGLFTAAPKVVATADTETIGDQVKGVAVSDISAERFRLWIYRSNTQPTSINWIAVQS